MKIILASAKTMTGTSDVRPESVPMFLEEARGFARDMMGYPAETVATMLGCSMAIASRTRLGYLDFFTDDTAVPAVIAYTGQAYRHLRAAELTAADLAFAQRHLLIVSFLYGLLRPLDGIRPYRLEGKVCLPSGGGGDMFAFWRSRLTDVLIDAVKADGGTLLHLATDEFQHLFDWKRVSREVRVVRPLFYVGQGDTMKIQAVWAKACRGAMARYVIANRIESVSQLPAFDYEGFSFRPTADSDSLPLFVRGV